MKLSAIPAVSVVIPVYNQSQHTQRCLDSLLKNSTGVRELFVVDNGSTDNTQEILNNFRPLFKQKRILFEVLTNESNMGFGRACNRGIVKMTGDYLVVLNNDTWLMPGWDEVLLEKCVEHRLDCIGPYFYEHPFDQEEKMVKRAEKFSRRNQDKMRKHFVPILMMFSRDAFEKLKLPEDKLFDDRFFITYEDTDIVERMKRAGMAYAQTGACFIWHASMGTRKVKGALPPEYEKQGLQLFKEKWGFDPRKQDHSGLAKIRRSWWKFKEHFGFF